MSINVPLLDLKAQYAPLKAEIRQAIDKVCDDQWFVMGPEVQAFEREIAEYIGVKHAVGVASGSDALLIALMALNIGCGGGHNGRVVCPSFSFFATGGAIWRLGAFPAFTDIDPTTYNAAIEHTREVATSLKNEGKLAALMPVHLFGQAVNMDDWLALASELDVPVIEDAAQAIGAKDHTGAMAGTRGTVGCFSFFPSKNLGAFGEGGLCTTNDDDLAERMRMARVHGSKVKYEHEFVGLNGRLHALQAAVLRIKLRHLESWHKGRRENAAFYDHAFAQAGAQISGSPFDPAEDMPLRTPAPAEAGARHIYNQYTIRVPAPLREQLREHLKANNIGHDVYYPIPMHRQACFEHLGYAAGSLPESEAAAAEVLSIPIYPELTAEQKQHVADTITSFLASHAKNWSPAAPATA